MSIIQLEHHPKYLEEIIGLEYDFDRDTGVLWDIINSTLISIKRRIQDRMEDDYIHLLSLDTAHQWEWFLYASTNQNWVRIWGLYVRQESRKKWIAQELIQDLQRKTQKSLISQISVKNEASIELHRKLWFDLCRQSPWYIDSYLPFRA